MPNPTPMKKNDNVWFSHVDSPVIVSRENTSYLYRQMNIERRLGTRLDVNEGVYSVIDSYAPQICQITNIGAKGLSYVYFKGDDPMYESLTMDILVKGFGFCLERIPFRKVADYKITDDNGEGQFEKRMACVEFVDLSEKQIELIEMFINAHIKHTVN